MRDRRRRVARAWLFLVGSVAVHVTDEALTGFLPFYNQLVTELRERWGFLPFPTFTFPVWLGGLILAIVLGAVATPWISRGGRWARRVAAFLSLLMVANALGHLLGSVYFGRLLPGFWSSPLLLVAALGMVLRGIRRSDPRADGASIAVAAGQDASEGHESPPSSGLPPQD